MLFIVSAGYKKYILGEYELKIWSANKPISQGNFIIFENCLVSSKTKPEQIAYHTLWLNAADVASIEGRN